MDKFIREKRQKIKNKIQDFDYERVILEYIDFFVKKTRHIYDFEWKKDRIDSFLRLVFHSLIYNVKLSKDAMYEKLIFSYIISWHFNWDEGIYELKNNPKYLLLHKQVRMALSNFSWGSKSIFDKIYHIPFYSKKGYFILGLVTKKIPLEKYKMFDRNLLRLIFDYIN